MTKNRTMRTITSRAVAAVVSVSIAAFSGVSVYADDTDAYNISIYEDGTITIYDYDEHKYIHNDDYHAKSGYYYSDVYDCFRTYTTDGVIKYCHCDVCEFMSEGYSVIVPKEGSYMAEAPTSTEHKTNADYQNNITGHEVSTGQNSQVETGSYGDTEVYDQETTDDYEENTSDAEKTEVVVYIEGKLIDEDNLSGEGWSYDMSSNTLTLDSYSYEGSGFFSLDADEENADQEADDMDDEASGDDDEEYDDDEDGDDGEDEDDEDGDDEEDEDGDDEDDEDGEDGDDDDEDDEEEDYGEDADDGSNNESKQPSIIKGVINSNEDITICFKGESHITITDDNSDTGFAINVGIFEIEGDGVLYVKCALGEYAFGKKSAKEVEQVTDNADTSEPAKEDKQVTDNADTSEPAKEDKQVTDNADTSEPAKEDKQVTDNTDTSEAGEDSKSAATNNNNNNNNNNIENTQNNSQTVNEAPVTQNVDGGDVNVSNNNNVDLPDIRNNVKLSDINNNISIPGTNNHITFNPDLTLRMPENHLSEYASNNNPAGSHEIVQSQEAAESVMEGKSDRDVPVVETTESGRDGAVSASKPQTADTNTIGAITLLIAAAIGGIAAIAVIIRRRLI